MRAMGLGPREVVGMLDAAAAAGERLGRLARSAGANSSALLRRAHASADGVETTARATPFLGTPQGRVALERLLLAVWEVLRGVFGLATPAASAPPTPPSLLETDGASSQLTPSTAQPRSDADPAAPSERAADRASGEAPAPHAPRRPHGGHRKPVDPPVMGATA